MLNKKYFNFITIMRILVSIVVAVSVQLIAFNSNSGDVRHDRKKEDCIRFANQPQFKCVGRVLNDKTPTGSCVLIDSNWVLSAAHVFQDEDSPSVFSFIFDLDTVKGEKIILNPHFSQQYTDSDVDLALIKLKKSVREVKSAKIYSGRNELGKEISLVGFGVFGTALEPDMDTVITSKAGGANTIDQIGGTLDSLGMQFSKHKLIYDFDSPIDGSKNRIGSAIPLDVEYIMSGGDSGSGCFIEENGNWYLAGINVQATYFISGDIAKYGLYGAIGSAERVSDFKSWITQSMK